MANVPHKFKNGVAISGSAQVDGDTITTNTATQTLQNKTIDSSNSIDAAALPSNINAANIADGSVSNTEFQYLDGVSSAIQTQLDAKIDSSEKGAANGVATLDGSGLLPASQLPISAMEYKGTWAASTNTPTLSDGVGNTGDVYVASDAGTVDFGSGNITFAAGDWVIYNGTVWQKSINSNNITSVNGQSGVVVLDTDDIAEATNLYFTDERAQDAIGAMVANSTKVSLTYVDATPSLTADIVAGSLVNADINASAGIDATKLGNGDVDNTELSHLNGVSSAIQTQLDGKASTTLNNLGTTSINQALLTDGSSRNIGNSGGNHFASIFADQLLVGYGSQGKTVYNNAGSARINTGYENATSTPSTASVNATFRTVSNLTGNIGIFTTNDATNDAVATGSLFLETGNKTNGTGNSGGINAIIGTSLGGTQGDFKFLKSGVAPTIGDVWTASAVDGTGYWASPASAPTTFSDDVFRIQDDGDASKEIAFQASGITTSTTRTITMPDTDVDLGQISTNSNNISANTSDIADIRTTQGTSDGDTNLGTFTGSTISDNNTVKGALQELETEVETKSTASAGDIAETSFSAANNQVAAADVTGLAFANGTVRSFESLVSVFIDADTDLYEVFTLKGIQKGASWDMSVESTGDTSNITFTITSAGQVQYTSGNETGFVSNTMKFRAITTSV